jgi:hypothetical protein
MFSLFQTGSYITHGNLQRGYHPSGGAVRLDDIPEHITYIKSLSFQANLGRHDHRDANGNNVYGTIFTGVGFTLHQTSWVDSKSTELFKYSIDYEQSGSGSVEKTISMNLTLDHNQYRYNLYVYRMRRTTNIMWIRPDSHIKHFRLNCRSKLPF